MNIQVGDVIVLDGKKNVVLTTVQDQGNYYSFVNEMTDDGEDVNENYYVVKHDGGQFVKVTDENDINKVFPLIQEGLKASMAEFGIDVNKLLEQQQ